MPTPKKPAKSSKSAKPTVTKTKVKPLKSKPALLALHQPFATPSIDALSGDLVNENDEAAVGRLAIAITKGGRKALFFRTPPRTGGLQVSSLP
jgi:hypothetical protein